LKASGKTRETELMAAIGEWQKEMNNAVAAIQDYQQQLDAAQAEREKAQHDALQAMEKAVKSQWFLKLDDGSVNGPAPVSDLYDWAAQCRIGPDHEVSTDRQKWIRAKEVKELRMDWMVRLTDGSAFGPINMFAAHQLLVDQALAPNSDMVNPSTGEKIPVSKIFTPDVIAVREMNNRLLREMKEKDQVLNAEREQKLKLEKDLAAARTAAAPQPDAVTPGAPPQVMRQQIRQLKGG